MASLTDTGKMRVKAEPIDNDFMNGRIVNGYEKHETLLSDSPGSEMISNSVDSARDLSPPPAKKLMTTNLQPTNRALNFAQSKYYVQNGSSHLKAIKSDSVSSRSTPTAEPSPLSPRESTASIYEHHEQSQPNLVLKVMDEMRITGKFVDLIIISEEKEIPCHKVVICAVSDYFAEMLDLTLPEIRRHNVTEASFDIMSQMISFAYTSRLTITDTNIQQLLTASTHFKFSSVRAACMSFLKRKINPSNSIVLEQFAATQDCTELKDFARAYTLEKFSEVSLTQEFMDLVPDILITYISSDELNVQQEEAVYSAVMAWVRHNPLARKCQLATVLENVRLPLVKPQFLLDVVQTEPLIRCNKECESLLDEARRFQLLVDQRPLMQSSRTRPRNSYRPQMTEIMVVVGGLNKDKILVPDCFYYCFPDINSKPLAQLKVFQTAYSVSTVNNNIFVTGGASSTASKEVWMYVPSLNVWQEVASMLEARYLHTSVGLGNYLYVAGGHDGNKRLDSVERYNPDSNTWVKIQPMLEALSSPSAVTCDGCLYVIGGARGPSPDEIVSKVQCYNHATESWTYLEPLPQPERGAVAANLNGIIYVLGQHRRVYAYNKHTNSWKKMNSTNGGHLHGAATVHKGRLYISGGLHGNNYINGTVEMYDQLNDSWCVISTLNTPVYAQGFVSICKDIK